MGDVLDKQSNNKQLRYCVAFSGWELWFPSPRYSREHSNFDDAEREAKRLLDVFPKYRKSHPELEVCYPEDLPNQSAKVFVYPNPFDLVCAENPHLLRKVSIIGKTVVEAP